jgi:hypothetical protein
MPAKRPLAIFIPANEMATLRHAQSGWPAASQALSRKRQRGNLLDLWHE